MSNNDKKTFVSSKGVELVLRPVSQFMLDNLRTSTVDIPVPQYEMTIAGGTKVLHPMDATIAQNQNRMDEWNEYQRLAKEQAAQQAQRFSEMVVWEGVEIDVPDKDSEWQKKMDHFGIVVADEPIARKLQYVYSEVLVGAEDIAALVSQILSVSQIPEEAVAKIRNSFRPAPQRNPIGRTRKNKRKVAVEQPDVQ